MVVYHMWAIVFGPPEAIIFRGTHLVFALTLCFLLFRAHRARRRQGALALLDYALLGLAVLPVLYLFSNYDYLVNRIILHRRPDLADMIMGALLVVMIIEATRRLIGWALPLTAIVFLVYAALRDPATPSACSSSST